MTVLPGSLDYLYHNRIIDHIPYEAYEISPLTSARMPQISGMGYGVNQAQIMHGFSNPQAPYINTPQMVSYQNGNYYNNQQNDMFIANSNSSSNTLSKITDNFKNSTTLKGIVAAGIMILTLCCMFKTGKKLPKQTTQNIPATETKTSVWEKIKGWFKKKKKSFLINLI